MTTDDSFTAENEEDKEAWAAMRAIHAAGPKTGPGFTEDPVGGRNALKDWDAKVDQKTAEHTAAWTKAQQEHTQKVAQAERDMVVARIALVEAAIGKMRDNLVASRELDSLRERADDVTQQEFARVEPTIQETNPSSAEMKEWRDAWAEYDAVCPSPVNALAKADGEWPPIDGEGMKALKALRVRGANTLGEELSASAVAEQRTVLVNVFRPIQTAFKNEYISVSRLQAYEQCPRMFYYRYVDKSYLKVLDSEMGPGTFGSFLHAAHESLVKWLVAEEFSGVIPAEIVREHARKAWEDTEGAKGVDLYAEGVGYIRKYFANAIDCWDILDVEREFTIQVGEFKVLGYMDLVKKTATPDGPGVKIVDYKSNRAMYSRDDLNTNMQLAVYTVAAKELYPWAKKIEAEMHMLRYGGKPQVAHITPEVLEHTKDYLIAMGRKTESDKEWKPVLNANCGYCEHKQHCEMFDQATRLGMPQTKAKMDDLVSVSEEREAVAKIANAAYARKKKLDEVLKLALEASPELVLGPNRYYLSHPSAGTEYDASEFFALLRKHNVPKEKMLQRFQVDKDERAMVWIEPKAVEAFLKTFQAAMGAGEPWANAMLHAEIEDLAVKRDGSPRLEMRKVK